MIREETFTPALRTLDKLRRLRLAAPAAAAILAFLTIAVVRQLAPQRKLLLFDLGIGLVPAAGLIYFAKRLIVAEAAHRRRVDAAIVIGVATVGAVLGIFFITLIGPSVGLGQLPQLIAIQLLGAVFGAIPGFFFSSVATWLAAIVHLFASRPTPRVDGVCIGGLAGLVGGLCLNAVPDFGPWYLVVATVAAALGGYRAARLHERLRP